MNPVKVAFVTAVPVFPSNLFRKRCSVPNRKRVPTLQVRAQKPTADPLQVQTSHAPKPPLPSSSRGALASSALLSLSALAIPTSLAIRNAAQTGTTIFSTITAYSSHYQIILYSVLFGCIHSGLASLRPLLTKYIGERIYRVIFALASLPSAVGLITYFIAHRYDGAQLWQLQGIPYMHDAVFVLTVLSFIFLYPATFNLLEVAAVQKPSFSIYESGIMRLTRHPQLTGQILWCISHTAWMGTSFSLTASLMLVAHHCFGAWNGDRRLRDAYGEEWADYAKRTSVIPLLAVLHGRQKLVLSEFFRWAYVGVALAVWGLYAAHPVVLRLIGGLSI